MQYVDCLIIGAGVAGIGLAAHLKRQAATQSFAILERRAHFGGTWDLFKYPGIRSDSDMLTFGFNFKPWNKDSVLASASAIKQYLAEVIEEYQLQPNMYFQQHVIAANYDSQQHLWSVQVQQSDGEIVVWQSRFLLGCTGYYNYDQPYQPKFKQQHDFQGLIIHPQHWPEQLDVQNKKVVVIGSGATAMTLVPALANQGVGHVTLLQRSPTYVMSIASGDLVYQYARRCLPKQWAYRLMRGRNIALQTALYRFARKQPERMRQLLLHFAKKQLDGKVDLKHFSPSYQPWDQRLCVVPNGDLFQALSSEKASIVTEQIEKFTAEGVLLQSGQHIDADIIVTATGLQVQLLGGLSLTVDGQVVEYGNQLLYRGMMLSNVPNFALMVGYTNAPWTLKVDIAAQYLCRLFQYMDKNQYTQVIAYESGEVRLAETVMGGLNSGYLNRATQLLPKQGLKSVWRMSGHYLKDRFNLKWAKFEDDVLQFQKQPQQLATTQQPADQT